MIEFRDVSKYYLTQHSRKVVVDHLSLTLPAGAKVGLLGRNGAGKSTMIGMIAGTVKPNTGSIRRQGSISWPLGFGGSFASDLTGTQNIRFVARIYGIDTDALIDYVQDFAELGDFLDMPVRSYSSGMKARLAFGLSMGVSFDWYLVDEITAVGDAAFRRKSLGRLPGAAEQRRPAHGLPHHRHHPQLLHLRPGARRRQGPLLRGRRGSHRRARPQHGRLRIGSPGFLSAAGAIRDFAPIALKRLGYSWLESGWKVAGKWLATF